MARRRKQKGLIAKAVDRHLRRNRPVKVRITHRPKTAANTAKAKVGKASVAKPPVKPQPKTLKDVHAQDDDVLKSTPGGRKFEVISKVENPDPPKPADPPPPMKPITVQSGGNGNVQRRKHKAPAGHTYVMDPGRTFALREGEAPRVENVPPDMASAAGYTGDMMVIDGWECLLFKSALAPNVTYAQLMPR